MTLAAMSLGCIADDYTGASDLANTLTRCGLRTVQTIGVPADDLALPEVDAVVVSLKSRSIEAGLAVSRSRAAEKWLRGRGAGHVLFKICSTFDSTDAGNIGPVMDALRADVRRCHRAGDAGVSGDRPHRLSGQSVRRLGAAERKPAEGSSAQSDARFQSGAGAGAPEQDQGRAGRSRRRRARAGRRPRASCRSRQAKVSARRSSMRCSIAISKPSARSRWIIASRSAHPASGSGLRARWSPRAGSNRTRRTRFPDAPVGGPAACLAGSCSQATLRQIANAEAGDAGAASRSRAGRRGQGRSAARAGLGQGAARTRPGPDRLQFDAGSGRGPAGASRPRCRRSRHRAGDGRHRRRTGAVRACGGWWSPAAKPPARWWIAWGFPAFWSARKSPPACRCCARSAPRKRTSEMLLALKSGNFGGPEFFSDALKLMR